MKVKSNHRLMSVMNGRTWLFTLAAVITAANIAMAQETGVRMQAQKWQATSRTSLAITGNITVSKKHIRLENGKTIMLKPTANDKYGIFTIDPPGNPTLLRGNKLCGDKPPTYILIYQEGHSLYLHVFDGTDMPRRLSGLTLQKGICATYNYEKMS